VRAFGAYWLFRWGIIELGLPLKTVVIAKEREDVVCAGGNAALALADGLRGGRRSAVR
jgi:hypothetical protein